MTTYRWIGEWPDSDSPPSRLGKPWGGIDLDRMREQQRAHNRIRRDRIRAGFVERVERLVVLERDDGVCGICGGDVDPTNFHVDHIEPLAHGGNHCYSNVRTAHPACNLRARHEV